MHLSPAVLLLSAVALRMDQVEPHDILQSESKTRKSSRLDSPDVTTGKSNLRTTKHPVEVRAQQTLSNCKDGDVNAMASGRALMDNNWQERYNELLDPNKKYFAHLDVIKGSHSIPSDRYKASNPSSFPHPYHSHSPVKESVHGAHYRHHGGKNKKKVRECHV